MSASQQSDGDDQKRNFERHGQLARVEEAPVSERRAHRRQTVAGQHRHVGDGRNHCNRSTQVKKSQSSVALAASPLPIAVWITDA